MATPAGQRAAVPSPMTNSTPSKSTPTAADCRVVIDQPVVQALLQLVLGDAHYPIHGYLGGRRLQEQSTTAAHTTDYLHIQLFFPGRRVVGTGHQGSASTPVEERAKSADLWPGQETPINAQGLGDWAHAETEFGAPHAESMEAAHRHFESVGLDMLGAYLNTIGQSPYPQDGVPPAIHALPSPSVGEQLRRLAETGRPTITAKWIYLVLAPPSFPVPTPECPPVLRNYVSLYHILPEALSPDSNGVNGGSRSGNGSSAPPFSPTEGPSAAPSLSNPLITPPSACPSLRPILHLAINPLSQVPPSVFRQSKLALLTALDELKQAYAERQTETLPDNPSTCLEYNSKASQFLSHLYAFLSSGGAEHIRWIDQEYTQLATAKLHLKSQIAQRLAKLREAWEHELNENPVKGTDLSPVSSAQSFTRFLSQAQQQHATPTGNARGCPEAPGPEELDERVYWLDPLPAITSMASPYPQTKANQLESDRQISGPSQVGSFDTVGPTSISNDPGPFLHSPAQLQKPRSSKETAKGRD
ncbi:hypothetical protein BJ085DRAFT_34424 [Dimargaris cristalligena]|uniref:Uncharacterized protein n=1 Tax=Dimargaris cristalligena TaxID=215637 RepID=A0A4P9ZMI0_9FUNG|nr:hypothetical protein BJ085DRAFT_34424 [Dimargaris cristalligena]|eukprot:RKP34487.1 hypothetical protein BJ085DRAFT_34424 [Dimargaris cristalligena]